METNKKLYIVPLTEAHEVHLMHHLMGISGPGEGQAKDPEPDWAPRREVF